MALISTQTRNNPTLKKLQSYLPPLNFITVHYTYFIVTCLLCSVIFYGSSSPQYSISYTDSLFLVVSAMTEAGLNTVNLSTMTTFQQTLLWLLIVIGSAIFVSISTVLTRKRVFEQRFKGVVRSMKEGRRERRRSMSVGREGEGVRVREKVKVEEPVDRHEFESRHSGPRDPTHRPGGADLVVESDHEREAEEAVVDEEPHSSVLQFAPEIPGSHHRVLSFVGVGAHPNSSSNSY